MGGNKFGKMKAKYSGFNERIKKSEERQSKLEQAAVITLKGNFAQRRSGWSSEEINKASRFERGSNDRFKAH